jgi:hypothetical protein
MDLIKGIGLILIFIFGIIIQPIFWFVSLFIPKDKIVFYHNVRHFVHHNCDCDDCWHHSFLSQDEFEKIDKTILNLFNPLGHTEWYSPKPKVKFLFYEYGAENPEGGFIYECKNCNQLWELSVPDNAYRGYFKGIDLNKEEIEKYIKEKTTRNKG